MCTNADSIVFASYYRGNMAVRSEAQVLSPPEVEGRLANLISTIRGPHPRDDKRMAIQRMCNADWPDNLIPQVVDALQFVLQDNPASWISHALRAFSEGNSKLAAPLAPRISASLRDAGEGEKVNLLIALRSIGPPAVATREQVRNEMSRHNNTIVRIHAASALARMDPDDNEPRDLLRTYLRDNEDPIRWRAAYAIAATDQRDSKWIEPLTDLLTSSDVRVRIAAATALWRVTGRIESSLPTLVEALAEDDKPLSTEFSYPSFPGRSHRFFAVSTIGNMGRNASSAIPSVVKLIEETSVDADEIWTEKATAGMAALAALPQLGPDAARTLDRVIALTSRGQSVFRVFPEATSRHIEKLKAL